MFHKTLLNCPKRLSFDPSYNRYLRMAFPAAADDGVQQAIAADAVVHRDLAIANCAESNADECDDGCTAS